MLYTMDVNSTTEETLYFHVYNRGVEKRTIFEDENDYYRFLHDLYEFNDINPANPNSRRIVGGLTSNNLKKEALVEILCYCLMPNHFHLLLSVPEKSRLTQFMRKLGTGYTMYFNEKYGRVGSLFQGRYKSVLIKDDVYLKHLSRYIHLNPISLDKNKNILNKYRYSSYLDYIEKKNFPSIISKRFLLNLFKSTNEYRLFVENFNEKDEILNSNLRFD